MAGFQDRVALVTGGALRIDAEVARRLASGGAKLGVLDRDADAAHGVAEAIVAAGGAAVGLAADVTQWPLPCRCGAVACRATSPTWPRSSRTRNRVTSPARSLRRRRRPAGLSASGGGRPSARTLGGTIAG